MKTLKKIIPFMVITGFLTGCSSYNAKPGKLEHLVGTYELSVYKMRHNPDDTDTYDRKAEIGAVAYFSIDKDGYGFYAYKDNETAARVDQVFSTFTYDDEKPELIEAIKLSDGLTHKYYSEKMVGCLDEPPMGFRDQLLKKTLSYTLHQGKMWDKDGTPIPYQYAEYKRISEDSSLAKINSLMGTSASFNRPYEMKALKGYSVYRAQVREGHQGEIGDRGIYEYAVLDLNNISNGKANLYYSLLASPGRQVKALDISVNEKGKSVKVEGLGKVFYSEGTGYTLPIGGFATKWEEYAESDPLTNEWFSTYYGQDLSLEEVIEQERTPLAPYVMHRVADQQKNFESLSYNPEGEAYVDGLALANGEQFAICDQGYSWKYFEDYVEEDTAHGKVVMGTSAGTVWDGTQEVERHFLQVTEAGEYNIKLDTYGKIHVVH